MIDYTGTASLPTELDLANGQKYLFTYEPTPGQTGYYTGRIKRITLPTGGYVEYQYGGTNDGINCSDASVTNLTVVVSDGSTSSTWAFARAQNGNNWVTTVTAPQLSYDTAANQSVFTFNSSGQEIIEEFYQGSVYDRETEISTARGACGDRNQEVDIQVLPIDRANSY